MFDRYPHQNELCRQPRRPRSRDTSRRLPETTATKSPVPIPQRTHENAGARNRRLHEESTEGMLFYNEPSANSKRPKSNGSKATEQLHAKDWLECVWQRCFGSRAVFNYKESDKSSFILFEPNAGLIDSFEVQESIWDKKTFIGEAGKGNELWECLEDQFQSPTELGTAVQCYK